MKSDGISVNAPFRPSLGFSLVFNPCISPLLITIPSFVRSFVLDSFICSRDFFFDLA